MAGIWAICRLETLPPPFADADRRPIEADPFNEQTGSHLFKIFAQPSWCHWLGECGSARPGRLTGHHALGDVTGRACCS